MTSYQLGPYQLDPRVGVLTRDGSPAPLGPRAIAVLTVLVENAPSYVPKELIMERAWPGMVVEENNLSVQISAIRRALAQASGEGWLQTLPRRGYRFIGPVTTLSDTTPVRTLATKPHSNLPQPFTSFIGREVELADIRNWMSSHRLVTLTGAGGVGKTRMALQVAMQALDAYRDGVFLVELDSLRDPELVPQIAATVVGLKEQPGTSLMAMLTEYLQVRHLLLVLDNAEHLIPACAQLAEALMRQCPQVAILVTSRERLGVTGELVYRVPSLSIPDLQDAMTPESVRPYESVQLFSDRARLLLPQFDVTNQNASALASICRHLDGIALAIELAAARVRSMSVEEINQRLDQRFRLLTGGSRTASRRQHTLRAAIDWSYDLLSDIEKTLLGRLSVFSGGWVLEAAERICSGDGVETWEMLDLLTALTDKSLIVAEQHGGVSRYRLLETVRQYARDRLLERRDGVRWFDAHLAYFLGFVEEAEPQLRGAQQRTWLDKLEVEHDNIRSALTHSAVQGGQSVVGLRLAAAFWQFWLMRGHFRQGRGWLFRLLAAAPAECALPARARALRGAGVLAELEGDYPAARALYEDTIAIARGLGDRSGIAATLNNMGSVASAQGDNDRALELWEESLAIRRELGDRRGIADLLGNLGKAAYNRGDYASSHVMWEESLAIYRELDDRRGMTFALSNLGRVALDQGDYESSRSMWEESREIVRQLGDRWGLAWSLMNLGDLAFAQNDHRTAMKLHQQSLAIRRDLGNRPTIVDSLQRLAHVSFVLSRPLHAARTWGAVERLREQLGIPLSGDERLRYERLVASARSASGDHKAFNSAWQRGRALTLEQAIQNSLETDNND